MNLNLHLPLCLVFLLAHGAMAGDAGWPEFASDEARDQWLRARSPFYRSMAEAIDRNGGYRFRTGTEHPMGVVTYENGQRFIELHDSLKDPKRLSILAFEITNAFQQPKHDEIDAAARAGTLTSAREFGIRHELIELDGLRLHRRVLVELEAATDQLSVEMLDWISPGQTTLKTYEVPFAHDFIKAQESGGHTAHYWKWFERQVEMGRAQRGESLLEK
ncbi:MAG: hypothetical protein ABI680_07530 [Chthoniobacteraceae bacterium]